MRLGSPMVAKELLERRSLQALSQQSCCCFAGPRAKVEWSQLVAAVTAVAGTRICLSLAGGRPRLLPHIGYNIHSPRTSSWPLADYWPCLALLSAESGRSLTRLCLVQMQRQSGGRNEQGVLLMGCTGARGCQAVEHVQD